VRTGWSTTKNTERSVISLPSSGRIALVIGYYTGARKGEINKIRVDKI
jgi:hypothetical protein